MQYNLSFVSTEYEQRALGEAGDDHLTIKYLLFSFSFIVCTLQNFMDNGCCSIFPFFFFSPFFFESMKRTNMNLFLSDD